MMKNIIRNTINESPNGLVMFLIFILKLVRTGVKKPILVVEDDI